MLTSPGSGMSHPLGTISLAANASDADGRVVKVEFFANGQKLGEDAESPFAINWTPTAAGLYSLTARATDDRGLASTSVATAITLTAPPPDVATKPVVPTSACVPVTLALVIDGDTLQVHAGNQAERVRLSQVDAPERSQPYGLEATACLSRLVAGSSLIMCRDGKDPHGRTLAGLTANGTNVGQRLVAEGCAWAYTKYLESGSPLPGLEASARSARLGLWSLPSFVEPWLYRSGTSPVTYNATSGLTSVAVRKSNQGTVYDRVFDWAEHQYPELLVNGSSNQLLNDGTIYRCYGTGFCIGYRSGAFLTYDGKVIRAAGPETTLLPNAEAQGF